MVFTIHKSDGCRGSPATILSFQFYPPCYPPPFQDVRVKSISYSKIKRRRVNDRLSPTNSNKLVKNSLVIYLQTVRTIEFPLEFHNFDKRMKSNEESFVKIFLIKDPYRSNLIRLFGTRPVSAWTWSRFVAEVVIRVNIGFSRREEKNLQRRNTTPFCHDRGRVS